MDKTCADARQRTSRMMALACLMAGLLPGASFSAPPSHEATAIAVEHATGPARLHDGRCPEGADAFARTELFFGLSRPGGVITEEEFRIFVDARVTPRFPDGLTVLSGTGQFRDASGVILVEGAKVLTLLVPRRDKQASAKIEAIRSDYKRQFQQESVLRADAASCVSF
jgi:hypothetical protein